VLGEVDDRLRAVFASVVSPGRGTLETLQRVYAHWMRDNRDVPADALERILADFSRLRPSRRA